MAKLLGLKPSTVYRWTYARADGGTDGVVPGRQLRRILELAPLQVPPVVISASDLYPAAPGAVPAPNVTTVRQS